MIAYADPIFSKKRISVITNGALTSIPLQLLVTSEPTGKALKDVEWLVKSVQLNILNHARDNGDAHPRLGPICGRRRASKT